MAALNSRQKVIVAAMGIAILFGGYQLLFTGGKKGAVGKAATASPAELSAFVAEVSAALGKGTSTPVAAYAISVAERPWVRDPFYDRAREKRLVVNDPAPAPGKTATPAERPPFAYTGLVEVGQRKIAVINGNEYREGDGLEPEGYVLRGIFPNRVLIVHQETKRSLEIPLQE